MCSGRCHLRLLCQALLITTDKLKILMHLGIGYCNFTVETIKTWQEFNIFMKNKSILSKNKKSEFISVKKYVGYKGMIVLM